jgi:hypothetical protein
VGHGWSHSSPSSTTRPYGRRKPSTSAGTTSPSRRSYGTPSTTGESCGSARAAPEVGAEWTDAGTRREQRHLKSRPAGEWRPVPVPPPLTRLLRAHLKTFGTGPGGRVFSGVHGDELASITYRRVWDKARRAGSRPIRISAGQARLRPPTRLRLDMAKRGRPTAQVAEWAGHSVAVLLKVYAKCIEGQDQIAKRRIEEALCDPTSPRKAQN